MLGFTICLFSSGMCKDSHLWRFQMFCELDFLSFTLKCGRPFLIEGYCYKTKELFHIFLFPSCVSGVILGSRERI